MAQAVLLFLFGITFYTGKYYIIIHYIEDMRIMTEDKNAFR